MSHRSWRSRSSRVDSELPRKSHRSLPGNKHLAISRPKTATASSLNSPRRSHRRDRRKPTRLKSGPLEPYPRKAPAGVPKRSSRLRVDARSLKWPGWRPIGTPRSLSNIERNDGAYPAPHWEKEVRDLVDDGDFDNPP